jgi:hypothetical protein
MSSVLFDKTFHSTKQFCIDETSSTFDHIQIRFESSERKIVCGVLPFQGAHLLHYDSLAVLLGASNGEFWSWSCILEYPIL